MASKRWRTRRREIRSTNSGRVSLYSSRRFHRRAADAWSDLSGQGKRRGAKACGKMPSIWGQSEFSGEKECSYRHGFTIVGHEFA